LKARAVTDETSKANDDLNNFIASTSIATIFVDQGLHIKRYTPRATGIFNLIPVNIGRSLLDITHRLTYPKLTDDATSTFASLSPVEREVSSNDGRFYISRMLPYRTGDNRIRGVVLTFIDIISRHLAEEKVGAGEGRIQLFAESTKDYAIMTADADWRITSWNKGAERMFGHTKEEAIGQKLDIIYSPEDIAAGIPDAERKKAREQGRAEGERWHIHKDGSRLFCGGVVNALKDEDFDGYAKIARDLTARVRGRELKPAAPP
jgi:two-component system CheB/CheR fusion protein